MFDHRDMWNEFSFRPRPARVIPYQAGTNDGTKASSTTSSITASTSSPIPSTSRSSTSTGGTNLATIKAAVADAAVKEYRSAKTTRRMFLRQNPKKTEIFQSGITEKPFNAPLFKDPSHFYKYSDLPPIEHDVLLIAASLRDHDDILDSDDHIDADDVSNHGDKSYPQSPFDDDNNFSAFDSEDEPLYVLMPGKTYSRHSASTNEHIRPKERQTDPSKNATIQKRSTRLSVLDCIKSFSLCPSEFSKEDVSLPDIFDVLANSLNMTKISLSTHQDNFSCCTNTALGPSVCEAYFYEAICLNNNETTSDQVTDVTDDKDDPFGMANDSRRLNLPRFDDIVMFEDHPELKRVTSQKMDVDSSRKNEEKTPGQSDVGRLVWAKFTKTRWWPAIVISHDMCGQAMPKPGWLWLMWFGDYMISMRKASQTVCISHQFKKKVSGRLTNTFEEAVTEALQECARRASLPDYLTYQGAQDWGLHSTGFEQFVEQHIDEDPFKPRSDLELPLLVKKSLRCLLIQSGGNDASKDTHGDQGRNNFTALLKGSNSRTQRTASNTVNNDIDGTCLGCGDEGPCLVTEHPLFHGHICLKCKDSLRESLFAFDDDGCNMFCCICGEGGSLYVCETLGCGRSYCHDCMRRNLADEILREMNQQTQWACFLCASMNQSIHGTLTPREDGHLKLVQFMNPSTDNMLRSPITPARAGTPRQPLRVLTLGDCLGSVKLALQSLGLTLDLYAAAERDIKCFSIIHHHHEQDCKLLGDIWNINTDVLESLWPVDLVVATPPSDDLDLTNLEYEGFNGTGWCMAKVHSILNELRLLNATSEDPQRPLYWLIETTAAIKSEFRRKLAALFQMEPCMWDSQWFCPCVQPRLYWGNIPHLYMAFQFSKFRTDIPDLNQFLSPNFDRKARVARLQLPALYKRKCIPFCQVEGEEEEEMGRFSDLCELEERLIQEVEEGGEEENVDGISKGLMLSFKALENLGEDITEEVEEMDTENGNMTDNIKIQLDNDGGETDRDVVNENNIVKETDESVYNKPVTMDGNPDYIWFDELERLLGYPAHYTDVSGVSTSQRIDLLAQASNPRVLAHILAPLVNHYSTCM